MQGVEARNLTFRATQQDVLRGISFKLGSHEFVGLLGVNGAGKTTLLRLLLGLAQPRAGEVLLDGRHLENLSRRQVAQRMAYVPQAHIPSFPYSVMEIVVMGRTSVVGVGRRLSQIDEAAAQEALKQLGLLQFSKRSYTDLSGGERQAVLIARALAQGAHILIMDEPAASLDLGQQARLMTLLVDLTQNGYTIFMSTHQPDHVLRWCDRAVLLHEGRILSDGIPHIVMTSDLLSRLYGTPMRLVETEEDFFVVSSKPDRSGGSARDHLGKLR